MDPRLPEQSSGTPSSQQTERRERPDRQDRLHEELPSILPQQADSDNANASDEIQSRRTSSLSTTHYDQVRETRELHSPRSSTPVEGSASGSVKYTRTGRVSKAAKGQRIHACHIDGCEKVFSRAEHLRRHQLSHQPGNFPCEVPGCTRTFAREDLLNRHRARHNNPHEDEFRRPSSGSQSSAPDDGSLHAFAPAATSHPANATTAPVPTDSGQDNLRSEPSPRPPKRLPVPPNELAMPRIPLEVYGPFAGMDYNPWNPSYPIEQFPAYDMGSPGELFMLRSFREESIGATHFSTSSILDRDQPLSLSRSSTSDSCSTIEPRWDLLPPPVYEIPLSQDEDVPCASLSHSAPAARTSFTRESLEHHLGVLDLMPSEEDLELEERYIDAYFAWTHDQLPILHKPSFLASSREEMPLLRAAVLALGAQALGRKSNIDKAHVLHEKCSKMLKSRTGQERHTYRVSDMQAIVLVEMYSLFKSRNPTAHLSKTFEEVYHILSNDPVAIRPISSTPSIDRHTIDRHCKQRILLACYLLSQQYALLFGTSSTSTLPDLLPADLPFPTPQIQWDSPLPISHPSPNYKSISEALAVALDLTATVTRDYHDAFRSLLLITAAVDDSDSELEEEKAKRLLLQAIEPSPRVKLVWHTMMLCKHTSIADLLDIASASASERHEREAQTELRGWATRDDSTGQRTTCMQAALSHAFAILEIHRKEARTGCLFQEWAVFLAGIVIWAKGQGVSDQETNSIENPSDLDSALNDLLAAGSTPTAHIGPREARNVLLWIRRDLKVLPREWLVGRALETLERLLRRVDEK